MASPNSGAQSQNETFLETLLSHSHVPSHPISQVIYTTTHSSYASVLDSHLRNLRFTSAAATLKPILIITPTHESHVQAAIFAGKKHGLQMKIRSGGHDYEGVSYTSRVPFFLLDLFNFSFIDIDIAAETAWVGAGATLGELFYRIAEKSSVHGFPAGVCPTVAVGGHLSGGGYGNMMRKHGLTVDHVVDAKMVDARGRVLDRAAMGEDLFWAIRGGGGASFGVVLAYKINLVRVPETVTCFEVQRTVRDHNAKEIVHKWQQIAPNVDKNLFMRLVLDVVRRDDGGDKTVRATIIALFLGDSKTLLSITNQTFPELGLRQSDCTETSWIRSCFPWINLPVATPLEFLLERKLEKRLFFKRKSDYVKEPIPYQGWDFIFEKLVELEEAVLTFNPYGGKMAEVSNLETPFPHRAGYLWKIHYAANWDREGEEVAEHYINMLRKLYGYMTPFVSKNPRLAYFNYKDLDLGINSHGKGRSFWEGMEYGIKYFNGNFNRLVQIKTKVDPSNFFRNEQSIPTLPSGSM